MYQKISIIGNLGRDPEMRTLDNGKTVTTFNMATNRKYTSSAGDLIKRTTWFRVSVWNKAGEACAKYLHKGSLVFVEGRLDSDEETGGPRLYEKDDGTMGASFEMTGLSVLFLDKKSNNAGTNKTVSNIAPEEVELDF